MTKAKNATHEKYLVQSEGSFTKPVPGGGRTLQGFSS